MPLWRSHEKAGLVKLFLWATGGGSHHISPFKCFGKNRGSDCALAFPLTRLYMCAVINLPACRLSSAQEVCTRALAVPSKLTRNLHTLLLSFKLIKSSNLCGNLKNFLFQFLNLVCSREWKGKLLPLKTDLFNNLFPSHSCTQVEDTLFLIWL